MIPKIMNVLFSVVCVVVGATALNKLPEAVATRFMLR